jgi:hypothetical protein
MSLFAENPMMDNRLTVIEPPTVTDDQRPALWAWYTDPLVVISAALCVYGAFFIFRSSNVIGGIRYFSLLDDDMISMTYARNLAHGYGLVWIPGGPRVEGYTNLLWVCFMALFHLLPISAAKMSLCIQISGGIFLLLNLWCVREIARTLWPSSAHVATVAVLLTAFYFPLDNWALQGTEVSILTLMSSAAVLAALRFEAPQGPAALAAILGISTLVRPDAAGFAFVLLATILALSPKERWRQVITIGGVVALFLAAQTAFRIAYYGDLLPNTYYLKLTGYPLVPRFARGLSVALVFLLPLLPLLLLIRSQRIIRNAPRGIALLAIPLAGQVLYSIYVGGDAWESWGGCNRYVAVAMPLFMILAAHAIDLTCRNYGGQAARIGFAALTAGALALINAQNFREFLMLNVPPQTDENAEMVEQALLLDRVTGSDATIGLIWAGIVPYFARRPAIDLFGKNDRKIAHEPPHIRSKYSWWLEFWPGHNKWDYAYSIGEQAPDVLMQPWNPDPPTLALLASHYEMVSLDGFPWYLRRGSPHINREALKIEIAHSGAKPRFIRSVIDSNR